MENVYRNEFARMERRSKTKSLKYGIVIFTLLIGVGLFYLISTLDIESRMNDNLREKIYNSMTYTENRIKAYNRAVNLNNGKSINTCVYFLSEVLRMNGVKINDSICNTTQILDIMKNEGWKVERDYKKLKPGDICFTTDEVLNEKGIPTHTYIFMGWKEYGNYDYAYICDNQAKQYGGKLYHLRNIAKVDDVKGSTKEPFSFFMYK